MRVMLFRHAGVGVAELGGIQRQELTSVARTLYRLADHSGEWRAIGSGDEQKVEAHVLAQFTQLIFDGSARRRALWI